VGAAAAVQQLQQQWRPLPTFKFFFSFFYLSEYEQQQPSCGIPPSSVF